MSSATEAGEGGLDDVSVVVPVWDSYVDRFLADALAALEAEAGSAHMILVDNASAVPIPSANGNVTVCSSQRVSVGAARNLGLAAVETPYVVFWDADDILLPGALQSLRSRLRADPEAIAAVAAIVEDTQTPHHWPRRRARALAWFPSLFALIHCVSGLFPTTGSVLLRTDKVRDAGGFADADGGDDWVLGASLAFRGRVLFDAAPGRLYRQHPDSISRSWRPVPDLVSHASAVRRRLRHDPGVPAVVRWLTPCLAPLQLLVIFVLRPIRRSREKPITQAGSESPV
jgi:hypothetical protein